MLQTFLGGLQQKGKWQQSQVVIQEIPARCKENLPLKNGLALVQLGKMLGEPPPLEILQIPLKSLSNQTEVGGQPTCEQVVVGLNGLQISLTKFLCDSKTGGLLGVPVQTYQS